MEELAQVRAALGLKRVHILGQSWGALLAVEYMLRRQPAGQHVCRLDPWPEPFQRTLDKLALPVYERMWGPNEFTVTGTLKGHNCVERLGEINVPVLFTCGRYDEATPETTRAYQSRVPGSELVVFENASHLHHLEQKAAYIETVRRFLGRAEKAFATLLKN